MKIVSDLNMKYEMNIFLKCGKRVYMKLVKIMALW
jgi:hypothetical protein